MTRRSWTHARDMASRFSFGNEKRRTKNEERFLAYLVAVVATSAGTAAIAAIDHAIHIPNISLLYLPPILIVAVYFGTLPSLVAATVAVLEYDFFLLQPLYAFTINQVQDILAFVIFVVVALLTSQLAASARQKAESSQRRANESTTLYELGRALMSAHDVQRMLESITQRIVDVFQVDRCAIFVPRDDDRLTMAAETFRSGSRDRASHAAANWAFRRGTEVGIPAAGGTMQQQRLYVPLRTADRIVGAMEVGTRRGESLDADERRLVVSFAAQAALVIAQAQSEEERTRLRVAEESDRLKSALLNAVSHDLRTPLASIKASATTLLLAETSWTAEEGREMLQAIDHEADRLNRLVGNLLDLSRIEAGTLRPVLDWYDVQEVVQTMMPRMRSLIGGRILSVDVQSEIPPVHVDLVRIEELVMNLVENAIKYTPPTSPIELCIRCDRGAVTLAVIDHGPGVPAEQQAQIFEAFYQGKRQGDRAAGAGLGLAICRGVASAHGGAIQIADTAGGGATFTLSLPPSSVMGAGSTGESVAPSGETTGETVAV
jgi:two-component system, OmpR family, sensor histidine kinase KdpD